jgi:hypothetical protein
MIVTGSSDATGAGGGFTCSASYLLIFHKLDNTVTLTHFNLVTNFPFFIQVPQLFDTDIAIEDCPYVPSFFKYVFSN